MAARRKGGARPLAVKAAELAFAAPQVVAHRMTRMALASPVLSERDRKEFHRMSAEKVEAFSESWQAMAAHVLQSNQALGAAWLRSFWGPMLDPASSAMSSTRRVQATMLAVVGKGLAPIHRRAVANAKRLSRTKLR